MPDTPLNPDALEAGHEAYRRAYYRAGDSMAQCFEKGLSAYLAVAQPEVNSFDPHVLNRKGWTCGCEPGNYDTCDECQSACNELANFLNRPEVNDA